MGDDVSASILTAGIPPAEGPAEFLGLSGPETQLAVSKKIVEYEEQVARIHQRILELKSIHNAVTPFHTKLPSELLIQVFRHIEPTSRQHIQLSHVCRLWRSAIHQAPEFWVDILSTVLTIDHPHGLQLLKIFVQRSSPLHFGLSLPSRELPMVRQLPDNHRINSLSITFGNPTYRTDHDLLDLINTELPSLRYLNCYFLPSASFVDPPTMEVRDARTSDRIPLLCTLHTHGRCFTPAFIVASLCDLRIFGPATVAPDFILDALRACPGLETLMVENIRHHSEAEALMDVAPIPLGRLKVLKLVSLSGKRFVRLFLPHLKYSPTTQITITGGATCLSDFLCHSSPPTPTPAASTIQSLMVTITPDHSQNVSHYEVEGSSDLASSRLSMSLWCIKWGDDLDHLKLFVDVPTVFLLPGACNLTKLTFNFECGLSVSYENWEVVLRACSRIRHLAVRIASCRTLLRVLRREELLPQLFSLSITCENGSGVHESLVLAIESRAAMDVLALDELRFYNQLVARRKEVVPFPPFSRARLERLKARIRDVYTGAQHGAPSAPSHVMRIGMR